LGLPQSGKPASQESDPMLAMTITTERLKVRIVNSRRLHLVRARFIMLSESLKTSIEKRVHQQWKSCDCITIHQRSISVY
jgi:hypothetical protein